MPESAVNDFAVFSREKLKPAVDAVTARKRSSLYFALALGVAVFLAFAAAVSLFFAPYREIMERHGISYRPLLFLAPASLGMIAFCLAYILGLRRAVSAFRASLLDRMAEFIDPGVVREAGKTLPPGELESPLLAAIGGEAFPGADCFLCRVPGATARFADLRVARKNAEPGGGDEMLTGLYFYAVMERKFAMPLMVCPSSVEISRSGFEEKFRAGGDNVGTGLLRLDDPSLGRQILVPSGGEEFVLNLLSSPAFARLEEMRRDNGAELALSLQGDSLRVAMLSRSKRMDLPGAFEGFDFGHCREFCRDARLCLDLTLGIAGRNDVWQTQKTN